MTPGIAPFSSQLLRALELEPLPAVELDDQFRRPIGAIGGTDGFDPPFEIGFVVEPGIAPTRLAPEGDEIIGELGQVGQRVTGFR